MFHLICRGARFLVIPTIFDYSLVSVDLNSLLFTLTNVNHGMIIYASIFFLMILFPWRMRGTFRCQVIFWMPVWDTDFSFDAQWACYGIFKIHIHVIFITRIRGQVRKPYQLFFLKPMCFVRIPSLFWVWVFGVSNCLFLKGMNSSRHSMPWEKLIKSELVLLRWNRETVFVEF